MEYPGVLERVKAVAIDGIMMVIMMIAFYKLFSLFDDVSDYARGAAIIFVFVLYDPLTISLFGATLGHSSTGIMVKRSSDHSRNLPFHVAFFRFAVKIALGWISLIAVSINDDRKAVHDIVSGSIVLYQTNKES